MTREEKVKKLVEGGVNPFNLVHPEDTLECDDFEKFFDDLLDQELEKLDETKEEVMTEVYAIVSNHEKGEDVPVGEDDKDRIFPSMGTMALTVTKYKKNSFGIEFVEGVDINNNSVMGTFKRVNIKLKDNLTKNEIYDLEDKIYDKTQRDSPIGDETITLYKQDNLIITEKDLMGGKSNNKKEVMCFDFDIIKNYVILEKSTLLI